MNIHPSALARDLAVSLRLCVDETLNVQETQTLLESIRYNCAWQTERERVRQVVLLLVNVRERDSGEVLPASGGWWDAVSVSSFITATQTLPPEDKHTYKYREILVYYIPCTRVHSPVSGGDLSTHVSDGVFRQRRFVIGSRFSRRCWKRQKHINTQYWMSEVCVTPVSSPALDAGEKLAGGSRVTAGSDTGLLYWVSSVKRASSTCCWRSASESHGSVYRLRIHVLISFRSSSDAPNSRNQGGWSGRAIFTTHTKKENQVTVCLSLCIRVCAWVHL